MNATEAISIREYARQRGCTDTSVRKAIAAGKIVRGIIDQDTKRPKILPSIADAEWSSYTNPNYERTSRSGGKAAPIAPTAPPVDIDDEVVASAPPQRPGGKSLAQVKLLQAEVRLQTDAIELKRKKGELVDRKQVYSALFAAGQEVKNAVLSVPDRVIDAVISAPSRNEAHQIMYAALVEALTAIADVQNREITNQ